MEEKKKKKINTKKAKTAGEQKLKGKKTNKKNQVKKENKQPKPKKVKNENKEIKAKSKDTKMKFKYKHPKLSIAIKIIIVLVLLACVVGAGVAIGLIYGLWGEDFTIDMSELIMKENSVIIDAQGNVLAELNGDESRKIITLEEMSPYLPKAYIAIEDERYEQHHGVDFKRTAAAILSFVTNGGKSTAGGGSTITQQLVKNVTQDKQSTGVEGVLRKLKEWAKAYQIEEVLSKDQILEVYLNLIYIAGGGSEKHGVEIGAEYYFNKSAKDLSIAQCAFLAGINHSPNRYNPYGATDNTEKIAKRTKTVLSQMKKFNYVTQEEYDAAIAEVEAGFKFENGVKGNVYSSHTDALITQVTEQIMEEKQISKDAAETYLQTSGLKIYSTQVSSIQSVMEEEAKKPKYYLQSKKTGAIAQGAAVVVDPKTGYVVGCVGQLREKDTSRGLNRATSYRQTGSSIKPLADILPALEEGIITAATVYEDSYTVFGKDYDPDNYNTFTGKRNVRNATTTSQNVPFVKIMAELTPKKSMEYLKKMGVTTLDDEKDNNLALGIGGLTYGISPLEMAAAYAAIANNGTYIEPTFYTKVEDSEGKVVLEPNQKTEKVCSEETAYIVKDILVSVVKGTPGYAGTASYCSIKGMDVAAKTGTTNESKDRWLCGFTNYYATAAWYGYDQPERVSFGGTNPAGQLFDGIMTEIHKGLEGSTFQKPENVISATVCRTSGMLASNKCTDKYSEIFIKGKLPETCDAHQGEYTVCTESWKLANEFCPGDKREVRYENYTYEKERLGLWNTPSLKNGGSSAPTEYCDIHKKVEEVVVPEKPEENKPTEPEKPEENKPTEPEKPNEETPTKPENPDTGTSTEPEKPNEGNTSGDGNTSDGGNTSETGNTGDNNKPQT